MRYKVKHFSRIERRKKGKCLTLSMHLYDTDNRFQIVILVLYSLPSAAVRRNFRQTESFANSPVLKAFCRCSAIVERPLPNNAAIASCVHQIVFSAYITSMPCSLFSICEIRNSAVQSLISRFFAIASKDFRPFSLLLLWFLLASVHT